MKITESEIYELEKSLIKKHKRLIGHVKPRKIKLVRGVDHAGRADKQLEINEDWLKTTTKERFIEVLKHELAHYAIGIKYAGHREEFMGLCEKLGCSSDDLSYSFSRAMEEYRLAGMVEEEFVSDNESRVTFKKKPNWKVFREDALYNCSHEGELFKALRKRVGKSRKEIAKDMGISDYALKRLESRRSWFIDEKESPIIQGIVDTHNIDGDYRKKRDREIFKKSVVRCKFFYEQKRIIPRIEVGVMFWDDAFQKKLFEKITSTKKKGGDGNNTQS